MELPEAMSAGARRRKKAWLSLLKRGKRSGRGCVSVVNRSNFLLSTLPPSLLPSPSSLPGAQHKNQAQKLQAQLHHPHSKEGIGGVPRERWGGEEEEEEGQGEVPQDDEREGGVLLEGREGEREGRCKSEKAG